MNVKRIKSAVVAIVTAITTITSVSVMNASADYDNCDVNRDGVVNMTDLLLLNKYCTGQIATASYNWLDVNHSLAVDSSDVDCLQARVLGGTYNGAYFSRATGNTVAFPTVSGFIPNGTASSSASRSYMRYDYSTKTQLSNYVLTPILGTLNSREIIDGMPTEEDRYASYGTENSGIVALVYKDIKGNEFAGTGFIIDDHHIATAAHCVYDKDTARWYSYRIKLYDENGVITNTELTRVEAHCPVDYVEQYSTGAYDYALITVEEDLSNLADYDCTYFALGTAYNATTSAFANVPVYVTGSPYDLIGENPIRLYSAQGNVIDKPSNYNVLCHDISVSGGDSGAPVYTITKNGNKYTYTVIGIHNGLFDDGSKRASMITNYHLQFYYNNSNVSY